MGLQDDGHRYTRRGSKVEMMRGGGARRSRPRRVEPLEFHRHEANDGHAQDNATEAE